MYSIALDYSQIYQGIHGENVYNSDLRAYEEKDTVVQK